jgi:hypothetical protein
MRRILLLLSLAIVFIGLGTRTPSAQTSVLHAEITSATLLDPGHIQIEGTITCIAPGYLVDIISSLEQKGGRFGSRSGGAFTTLEACGPTPTQFTDIALGGPFHRGQALWEVNAFACIGETCYSDRSTGVIRIH